MWRTAVDRQDDDLTVSSHQSAVTATRRSLSLDNLTPVTNNGVADYNSYGHKWIAAQTEEENEVIVLL